MSDDERIDSNIATPNIYNWFKSGTIFTHAYVTTPDCCPSRTSIFTGQYVHNHHVVSPSKIRLLNMAHTMQASLSAAHYETGFSGKFLNGWPVLRPPPYFQKWTVGEGYTDVQFGADGRTVTPSYGPNFVFSQGAKYLNEWEKNDSAPWFLELAPSTPHEPFTPERKYAHLRFPWSGLPSTKEADRSDKPPYVRTSNSSELFGAAKREDQLRSLRTLDDRFTETIAHLTKLGELSRTLVIYISDNGFLWGEHGLTGKAVPYLSAIRVPMYMRGPGVKKRVDDGIVANIDIAPTIYAVTGIKPKYTVDGKSLLGPHRDTLLTEFRGGKVVPKWWSLVSKDWQYSEYTDGSREYYDLTTDPYELNNDPSKVPRKIVGDLRHAKHCVGVQACP